MTTEVNALVCKALTEDLSGLSYEKIKINNLDRAYKNVIGCSWTKNWDDKNFHRDW